MKIRVLWFVNIPILKDPIEIKATGGWLHSLYNKILNKEDIQLSIVYVGDDIEEKTFEYCDSKVFLLKPDNIRLKIAGIINSFCPQLIHIHGTEREYGLFIKGIFNQGQVLISIQGIMKDCSKIRNVYGGIGLFDQDIVKNAKLYVGLLINFIELKRSALREAIILKYYSNFAGRTTYDQGFIKKHGKNYYTIGEIMRPEFYINAWDFSNCQKFRLFFANCNHPRKGFKIFIEAIKKVQVFYPNMEIVIGGLPSLNNSYRKYVNRKLKRLSINYHCHERMSAEEIISEMKSAHIFISASLVDNSPNSICEAQLIGLPIISSDAGGISSLIENGRTGILTPVGDSDILAASILNIFQDDRLAIDLSINSQKIAHQRHCPEVIYNQLLDTYEKIIENSNNA